MLSIIYGSILYTELSNCSMYALCTGGNSTYSPVFSPVADTYMRR